MNGGPINPMRITVGVGLSTQPPDRKDASQRRCQTTGEAAQRGVEQSTHRSPCRAQEGGGVRARARSRWLPRPLRRRARRRTTAYVLLEHGGNSNAKRLQGICAVCGRLSLSSCLERLRGGKKGRGCRPGSTMRCPSRPYETSISERNGDACVLLWWSASSC